MYRKKKELLSFLIWREVLTVSSLMRYSICKSRCYFSPYSVGAVQHNSESIHLSAAEGYPPCSLLHHCVVAGVCNVSEGSNSFLCVSASG